MTKIKIVASLAVALFALTVTVTSASAQKEFVAPGHTTGAVKGINKGNPVFTTGIGSFECTTVKSKGMFSAEKSATEIQTVAYSGCSIFGSSAEVKPVAEYEFGFNASGEGTLTVLNTITINVPSAGCHITLGPSGNSNLGKITYANVTDSEKHKDIEAIIAVKGFSSTGSGGLCGGSNTTGEYKDTQYLDGYTDLTLITGLSIEVV